MKTDSDRRENQDKLLLSIIDAICADINDIYCVDVESETVSVVRQAGKVLGFNSDLEKRFGYNDAVYAYVQNNVFEKDRDGLLNVMRLPKICERLKKDKTISIFYRVFRNDELHYFRLKCTRLGSEKNFRSIVYAFMPEDFESSQSQVIHMLEKDEITGVYTKQAFYQHAEELLDGNPEKDYDIVITDVENFKMVNRIYGRPGGDGLLRYLGERYLQFARGGLCGRYGTDQFIIICEAIEDNEIKKLYSLADDIIEKSPIPYVTLRYGINRHVDRNDTIADMCDKAAMAMQSTKNSRENPITFYDGNVIQKRLRSQMFEAGFERAIAEHEFVVWCQPKYSAFTKRMTSAEALVRWKTSDGKFVSPGEFIPVFESDGLIIRLDEYVFRYVCNRQKRLLNAGKELIPISVNISRATLFSPGSVERYAKITEEIGIDKKYVPLEVTESATVENDEIGELMIELKKAGFTLYMDDFGAGYSSLSGLFSLNFDALKLDKSLIDGIGNVRGDETLRHIIELAHFCQMEVVAEGVEQNSQYNYLKKLNCDTIQGYLFSKPVPFDAYCEMRDSQPAEESTIIEGNALSDESNVGSLRITNDVKLQYLSSLARIYMTMHVIDLKEDTVVEFATTTNVKEHANCVHNTAGQMTATMTATVAPECLNMILEFTDLSTISDRMKGKKCISTEFVGKHFGLCRASFITVKADENDKPVVVIFTTQVLEADSKKEAMLIRACRTDELTGVYNRTAFDEDIAEIKDPSNHEKEYSCDMVVMSVDINGLKAVNEVQGRSAGDELIWGIADTLNTVLGKGSFIYRLGADKFVAFFYADAGKIEKIREDYENAEKSWIGDKARSLSTSYGIVSHSEFPDINPEELIQQADKRRLEYKAKHFSGN